MDTNRNIYIVGCINYFMKAKQVKKCKCLRCGFLWFPRNPNKKPIRCANVKCRSPYWNKPKRENKND